MWGLRDDDSILCIEERMMQRILSLREIRPTYFSEVCIRKGSNMPGRQWFSAGDDQ